MQQRNVRSVNILFNIFFILFIFFASNVYCQNKQSETFYIKMLNVSGKNPSLVLKVRQKLFYHSDAQIHMHFQFNITKSFSKHLMDAEFSHIPYTARIQLQYYFKI